MPLPVFYCDEMVADSESYSPSAAKPRAVVQSWRDARLPLEVIAPAPATVEELSLAHDHEHVRATLAGEKPNGFGNRSLAVAASLPYTNGAMLSGARHALEHGGAAAAPCSGFHHAWYDEAGAFCTFNGLMVTACALRAEGKATRVGILDCDHHYGDGTDAIIKQIGAEAWIQHFTTGLDWRRPHQARIFLRELPALVREMQHCDVILYQAGADPHVDDPLGGWMTTDQLRQRDEIVFAAAHEIGVPVVWNLAGGYQRDREGGISVVLEIHLNTARACVEVYGVDGG